MLRRLGRLALIILLGLGVTGCGIRLDTPPPSPPEPDSAELSRRELVKAIEHVNQLAAQAPDEQLGADLAELTSQQIAALGGNWTPEDSDQDVHLPSDPGLPTAETPSADETDNEDPATGNPRTDPAPSPTTSAGEDQSDLTVDELSAASIEVVGAGLRALVHLAGSDASLVASITLSHSQLSHSLGAPVDIAALAAALPDTSFTTPQNDAGRNTATGDPADENTQDSTEDQSAGDPNASEDTSDEAEAQSQRWFDVSSVPTEQQRELLVLYDALGYQLEVMAARGDEQLRADAAADARQARMTSQQLALSLGVADTDSDPRTATYSVSTEPESIMATRMEIVAVHLRLIADHDSPGRIQLMLEILAEGSAATLEAFPGLITHDS